MNGEQIFYVVIAGIIAMAAVAVVPILGYYLSLVRTREQTALLKQALIERGFSADEICRVIEAGRNEEAPAVPPTPGVIRNGN